MFFPGPTYNTVYMPKLTKRAGSYSVRLDRNKKSSAPRRNSCSGTLFIHNYYDYSSDYDYAESKYEALYYPKTPKLQPQSPKRNCIKEQSFRIKILKTMKLDYGTSDGPFTAYRFAISTGNLEWKIRKRYSEFEKFNEELLRQMQKLNIHIQLHHLPPKTFRKRFDDEFTKNRHFKLCEYLKFLLKCPELTCVPVVMQFIGLLDNLNPTKERFLQTRISYSSYVSDLAKPGDIILFQTRGILSSAMRNVTLTEYDHVGAVVFFKNENSSKLPELRLLESTADGVHTYNLRYRLRQWNILCPRIVVRRLTTDRKGKFNSNVKDFADKVEGMDYGIWSNIFRIHNVPLEDEKSYFCSQLITALFVHVGLFPIDTPTHRSLPGDFSEQGKPKLLKNSKLGPETLIIFDRPAVQYARYSQIDQLFDI